MGSGRRALALGAAALSVVLTATACGSPQDEQPGALVTGFKEHNPDGMNGAVLADQYRLPNATLTATDGKPFALAKDTDTPLTLIFFGYTHCPDICHIVMADIASALTRLPEAQRDQVEVLLITTDPERDTPAVLRDYLDRFNPEFEGVTGDLSTIVDVGKEVGVLIEEGRKLPSGGYEVNHGTQILALDEKDRVPVVWTEGTSAAAIAEDLSALLADRAEQ